jgi:hypothetical protein
MVAADVHAVVTRIASRLAGAAMIARSFLDRRRRIQLTVQEKLAAAQHIK